MKGQVQRIDKSRFCDVPLPMGAHRFLVLPACLARAFSVPSSEILPTLRKALHMTAVPGCFLSRKAEGEPGVRSLWIGLQRMVSPASRA